MNSVLLINKPAGITSRDVINELNHIFHTKQIGHTGTLDPMATGVLVVCIGQATKLVELLTSEDKEYIAKIKLGVETDTLDTSGRVIKTMPYCFTQSKIKEVLNSFIGTSTQEVPIYSAVKIKGKKLYEYARNNEKVELPKRTIHISHIELLSFTGTEIEFKCSVSKGTYIRSLIKDICTKLGTCGSMSSLIRTRQGAFTLASCYSIEDIQNGQYQLLSIQDVLSDLEQIILNDEEYLSIKNGQIVPKNFSGDKVVFIHNHEVVAIYQTYPKDNKLAKPYKMFIKA